MVALVAVLRGHTMPSTDGCSATSTASLVTTQSYPLRMEGRYSTAHVVVFRGRVMPPIDRCLAVLHSNPLLPEGSSSAARPGGAQPQLLLHTRAFFCAFNHSFSKLPSFCSIALMLRREDWQCRLLHGAWQHHLHYLLPQRNPIRCCWKADA